MRCEVTARGSIRGLQVPARGVLLLRASWEHPQLAGAWSAGFHCCAPRGGIRVSRKK
ncbi:conserved hypothetical protein [Ricinus communis]|uniref:Uncharacterized protein n=1 Tax=Ricinus communis TaxID=3988 RepID=B9RL71_RICCO|nr:conserved hypothetical protein [Ricinus communis]